MLTSMLAAILLSQMAPPLAATENPEQKCLREAAEKRAECVNSCTSRPGDEMNSCIAACQDPQAIHETCRTAAAQPQGS